MGDFMSFEAVKQVVQYIIAIAALLGVGTPLVMTGMWIQKVNHGMGSIEKIFGRIDEINESLVSLRGARFGAIKSASPRTLSEVGKRILRNIKADDLVKTFVSELNERTRNLEPYQIQDLCFDYLRERVRSDRELEDRLRRDAYANGVDLWTVMDILSIELRDMLLQSKNGKR